MIYGEGQARLKTCLSGKWSTQTSVVEPGGGYALTVEPEGQAEGKSHGVHALAPAALKVPPGQVLQSVPVEYEPALQLAATRVRRIERIKNAYAYEYWLFNFSGQPHQGKKQKSKK